MKSTSTLLCKEELYAELRGVLAQLANQFSELGQFANQVAGLEMLVLNQNNNNIASHLSQIDGENDPDSLELSNLDNVLLKYFEFLNDEEETEETPSIRQEHKDFKQIPSDGHDLDLIVCLHFTYCINLLNVS